MIGGCHCSCRGARPLAPRTGETRVITHPVGASPGEGEPRAVFTPLGKWSVTHLRGSAAGADLHRGGSEMLRETQRVTPAHLGTRSILKNKVVTAYRTCWILNLYKV